jgi:Fe-S cluster assembly protein SufD
VTGGATVARASEVSSETQLAQITALRYPTQRDEAWRHAPHTALGRLSFGLASATAGEVSWETDAQIPVLGGPRIVIVNGVIDHARSDITALQVGLDLSTTDHRTGRVADRIAVDPGSGIEHVADVFVALNVAFSGDGVGVHVAAGRHLDAPVHIVMVSTSAGTHNTSCGKLAIQLDAGSSAKVVETRLGEGSEFGGSNTRTTIVLGDNATLDHVIIQDVPSTQVHLSRTEVTQRSGSELRARLFNLGAAYGRLAYEVQLAGEGAQADLSGLYFGSGDQMLDQQINVIHAAENCTSRQAFRGVLDDESTGVFNGAIEVRHGADGTDAAQSNDNLLLSNRAEANTQPRLEILADDVACKHGATVGQLDDEAMYYLRTRGIAVDGARRILINGFADQAVHDVGIGVLRTWIAQRLGHDND